MKVTIENLIKRYGRQTVIDIPCLSIESGEIWGLVGNNGAGKTTLFRLMLDLCRCDGGTIRFGESNVVTETEAWKNSVTAFLDQSFLIDFYTPREYFSLVASLRSLSREQIEKKMGDLGSFLGGVSLDTKLIRELSDGNRQKVGIAAALLPEPRIVLLDEPFVYLDPTSACELNRILEAQNRLFGTTILLSSNILQPLMACCRRIAVMENGRIIRDDGTTPNNLKAIHAYFSADSKQ